MTSENRVLVVLLQIGAKDFPVDTDLQKERNLGVLRQCFLSCWKYRKISEFNRISWDFYYHLSWRSWWGYQTTSDIEKCNVENVAVVAKGEAAKEIKIGTNTGTKKFMMCDKCGKYLSLIPALLNQFTGAIRAPGGGWIGGRGDLQPKNLLNSQILRNQWVQSKLLRFLLPLHLKKLMRLPNCQNFQ